MLERDSVTSPWRVSDQPLPGDTVVAAAAVRSGARVQAIVSVQPQVAYPPSLPTVITDPNSPAPLLPPNPLPASGYLLRETANGWIDDEQTSYTSPTEDKPSRPIRSRRSTSVPTATGGPSAGGAARPTSPAAAAPPRVPAVSRCATACPRPASTATSRPADRHRRRSARPRHRSRSRPAQANFLVAGNAACAQSCADLRDEQLAPDQNLTRMMGVAANLINQPGGPRALLLHRRPAGERDARRRRREPLCPAVRDSARVSPSYPAISADISGGGDRSRPSLARSVASRRRSVPARRRTASSAGSIPGRPIGDWWRADALCVRQHRAGRNRWRRRDRQLAWVARRERSVPESGRAAGTVAPVRPGRRQAARDSRWMRRGQPRTSIPSSRRRSTLPPMPIRRPRSSPRAAHRPTCTTAPEEQRTSRVPAAAATTIPEYGTGTLGYRFPLQQTTAPGQPDALFGQTGYLIVSVDTQHRNADTNVAPVTASWSRCCRISRFQAVRRDALAAKPSGPLPGWLGRRPVAGDRWGPTSAGDASPNPPGADPYTTFPPDQCLQANCSSFVAPQYSFKSSRPGSSGLRRAGPELAGSSAEPLSQDSQRPHGQ